MVAKKTQQQAGKLLSEGTRMTREAGHMLGTAKNKSQQQKAGKMLAEGRKKQRTAGKMMH